MIGGPRRVGLAAVKRWAASSVELSSKIATDHTGVASLKKTRPIDKDSKLFLANIKQTCILGLFDASDLGHVPDFQETIGWNATMRRREQFRTFSV